LEASPEYGRSWKTFATQAGSASKHAPGAVAPLRALDGEVKQAIDAIPQAREALQKVQAVLKSKSPSRTEIEGVEADLAEVERQVREQEADDPGQLEKIRETIAELRRRIEEKLLEVARIEPSFDVRSRERVRVAVVKIGDGVGTIRAEERALWRSFLASAGFDPDPVFVPAYLAGADVDAAAVRVAAARLGADAVLAWTTFAASTSSPFGESAAVLSFAKCMFVDVRTEYLYFNAEGECRKRRVGPPFTVCARCVEEESLAGSVKALRDEILHELERLEAEKDG